MTRERMNLELLQDLGADLDHGHVRDPLASPRRSSCRPGSSSCRRGRAGSRRSSTSTCRAHATAETREIERYFHLVTAVREALRGDEASVDAAVDAPAGRRRGPGRMTGSAASSTRRARDAAAGQAAELREWAPPVLLFVGFLVAWELIVRVFAIEQFVLPSPIAIAEAWVTLPARAVRGGELHVPRDRRRAWSSGRPPGSRSGPSRPAIGRCRTRSCRSRSRASSVPILAFAPLFNNWFGLDQQLSKAMVAAALCFFPVMINTVRGLTHVDPAAVELLRSMAAPRARRCSEAPRPQRAAVRLHGAPSGGDPGDDRRDRRRVLRGAAGQPRPVHRDVLRVPQLRTVVGRHRLRLRHRDRAVRRRRDRGAAGDAVARSDGRPGARRSRVTGRIGERQCRDGRLGVR